MMRKLTISGLVLIAMMGGAFYAAMEYEWKIKPVPANFSVDWQQINTMPCHLFVAPEREKLLTKGFKVLQMGGGGDRILINPGNIRTIYDSSSPATPEKHDSLAFYNIHPSAVQFSRVRNSLLICSQAYWLKIQVVRHYCRSPAGKTMPAWNNQIEEISFPHAREIWLSHTIFKKALTDQAAAMAILRKYYKKPLAMKPDEVKRWRFKSFRSTLPHRLWASYYCHQEAN